MAVEFGGQLRVVLAGTLFVVSDQIGRAIRAQLHVDRLAVLILERQCLTGIGWVVPPVLWFIDAGEFLAGQLCIEPFAIAAIGDVGRRITDAAPQFDLIAIGRGRFRVEQTAETCLVIDEFGEVERRGADPVDDARVVGTGHFGGSIWRIDELEE